MRILMLGNSLTTANGLPDLLAEEVQAEVIVHARGGARLSEHLNPSTKLGAKTQEALAKETWDYVVLQEMSNGPIRFHARYLEAVDALAKAIHACGATPIIYATWAYSPECPKLKKLGLSHDQMHDLLHEASCEAAQRTESALADAGLAFFQHPEKSSFYAPDGVHPSLSGTQVALDCLAKAIADDQTEAAPPDSSPQMYTVYLLRCEDGSYYTGITTDIERRLQEHLSRGPKAARYTRTHPVAALAATWEAAGRAEASRMEYQIKQLSHQQKAALEQNPNLFPAPTS